MNCNRRFSLGENGVAVMAVTRPAFIVRDIITAKIAPCWPRHPTWQYMSIALGTGLNQAAGAIAPLCSGFRSN
jgi:hypothetical protein